MDQAAKLREYKRRKNLSLDLKMISVVSGKGGVGKTTLTKELYEEIGNSLIIDCDFSSIYVWGNSYSMKRGYELKRAKSSLRDVFTTIEGRRYNSVIVDCGTGLNQINSYYIEKSKATIIVTTLEEISVLNTANMLKRIDGPKIVFVVGATAYETEELQSKINLFSQKSLNDESVLVFRDVNKLSEHIIENC